MTDQSARLVLPLLAAGQAGKEVTHNEALTRLDLLVQPAVAAIGVDAPPAAPRPGQCWVVGAAPSGDWAGQAQALAGWTEGGWRFVAPFDGLAVWNIAAARPATYHTGLWREGDVFAGRVIVDGKPVVGARAAAIPDPDGGSVIDEPARRALTSILNALRQHGLIAGTP